MLQFLLLSSYNCVCILQCNKNVYLVINFTQLIISLSFFKNLRCCLLKYLRYTTFLLCLGTRTELLKRNYNYATVRRDFDARKSGTFKNVNSLKNMHSRNRYVENVETQNISKNKKRVNNFQIIFPTKLSWNNFLLSLFS